MQWTLAVDCPVTVYLDFWKGQDALGFAQWSNRNAWTLSSKPGTQYLLGELLGKSKMGARLAANLAMGSTPKSKAGARVAAELALALGDGAAVATVPPPAREAASTMGGGGGFSCVSCGTEDSSAFSKRMLNKRGRHGDRAC